MGRVLFFSALAVASIISGIVGSEYTEGGTVPGTVRVVLILIGLGWFALVGGLLWHTYQKEGGDIHRWDADAEEGKPFLHNGRWWKREGRRVYRWNGSNWSVHLHR